ncbi:3-oxo-tetronate kinase [Muricoccus aerilatus]|uniref:3-oxo-tetronate kinase n=1 Tax=Muricoccus aerilatus TaxID=452982 RepID=UPI0005C192DD|nr:3-oxo-tetronate kinase [Roseomonas aerilata]
MPLLGCVADDFTGATDLASTLVRGGMSAVQVIGVPEGPLPEADAVVVALKSRTNPPADAVRDSLAALDALRDAGCRQFFFKYCSTFDSTDEGNIGPVADALLERLGAGFALACPAFPANGRSVYRGHLFVGDVLLSESGMKDHPLTPMRDPNLVRVLGRQTAGRVGLVNFPVVERGAGAIRDAMAALATEGHRYAIVDAVTEADLMAIGEAAAEHPMLTGGSGVAMGLPENFRRQGLLPARDAAALPTRRGHKAVLAGSCSRATLGQVAAARASLPVLELDPLATPDAAALARQALDWAEARLGEVPVVIAASAPPEKVAALQAQLGRGDAGALVEEALATVAEGLVARGVGQLVVAGGETSGAVVSRLGLRTLRIGPEIDPGVPWTHAEGASGGLHLALKSGNFGAADFFTNAFQGE